MSIISMPNLGSIGNLCSQMQQYASLYAIAKETNKEIVLPESRKNAGFGVRIFDVLDIPHKFVSDDFFLNYEMHRIEVNDKIPLDDRVFQLDTDKSYIIDGRFDLPIYWKKYADEILDVFKVKQEFLSNAENIVDSFRNQKTNTLVGIHVRRGDYLLPQHHHFVNLSETHYYTDANDIMASKVNGDLTYLVFSNDIDWCKKYLIDEEDGIFIDTGSDYLDFAIMTLCNHMIIANSSFSLWGALLNKSPNKVVVCPKNYLHEYSEYSHINGNYYPEDWVAI